MDEGEDRERVIDVASGVMRLRKALAELEPHWTKEPPTEPGFYWVRTGADPTPPAVARFSSGVFFLPGEDVGAFPQHQTTTGWLFWSERLEPPAAEE